MAASCQPGVPDRTDKASPHWSRGIRLGEASLNHAPVVAVGSEGSLVVFRHGTGRAASLWVVGLDRSGRVRFSHELDTGSLRPSRVRAATAAEGVHLLWSAGPRSDTLAYGWLGWDGHWRRPPAVVLEELGEGHDLAALPEGGALAVAADRSQRLVSILVPAEGQPAAPLPIGAEGEEPDLNVDEQGRLHVAWLTGRGGRREVLYGRLSASGALEGSWKVAEYPVGTGLVEHGPVLGLLPEGAVVLWSFENRSGLSAGSAEAFYVLFDLDQGTAGRVLRMTVPDHPPLRYPQDSRQVPGSSAIPAEGSASSFIHYPYVPQGTHDPLPVALTVGLEGRTRTQIRPVLAYLGRQGVVGWEEAAQLRGVSTKPALAVGPQGELHLAWLSVGASYSFPVYYAATTPEAKAHLDPRTAGDVGDALLLYGWSLLGGLGLGPIMVALWTVPAGMWLILFFLVSASDNLAERRVQVAFGVAVVIYLAAQLLITPGVMVTQPWFRGLSQSAFNVAVVLLPTLLLLVAVAVTLGLVRRREITSLPKAFALFVLADALLVMLLYLPGFVLVE